MSKNNGNGNSKANKTNLTQSSNLNDVNEKQLQTNDTIEEGRQSFNHSVDETKKNIQTAMNESRKQIPQYTQTINNFQEQSIQATEDMCNNYLEYQKQAFNTFQSLFQPYFDSVNRLFINNNEGNYDSRRLSHEYSKLTNNFAENLIRSHQIFNDIASSNMDMLTAWISSSKEQSKSLMELGRKNLEVYDNLNPRENNG
jgi:hypothetical protein